VFGPSFTTARTRLREAHKLVFDHDFSALVCEAAKADPEKLCAMLNTARMPFEQCWIEWNRSTMPDIPGLHPMEQFKGPWGALVTPRPFPDQYEIMLAFRTGNQRDGFVLPGGLLVNFREVLPEPKSKPKPMARREMLDSAYRQCWSAARYDEWLDTLAGHTVYWAGAPPYGNPLIDLIDFLFGREVDAEIGEFFNAMAELAGSAYREIIAGCALVATHVGGSPLVREVAARSKSTYYKGKFHPAIEYKVIQLARPMPAPHLWRRAFPRGAATPARFHTVIGSWHHNRAPNRYCAHHPRACPIALWQPVAPVEEPTDLPDKAPPERHDQQACSLCRRKRWWVRDHARGNPDEGMLEKGYEITATSGVI
jgi:hypothetical protein